MQNSTIINFIILCKISPWYFLGEREPNRTNLIKDIYDGTGGDDSFLCLFCLYVCIFGTGWRTYQTSVIYLIKPRYKASGGFYMFYYKIKSNGSKLKLPMTQTAKIQRNHSVLITLLANSNENPTSKSVSRQRVSPKRHKGVGFSLSTALTQTTHSAGVRGLKPSLSCIFFTLYTKLYLR